MSEILVSAARREAATAEEDFLGHILPEVPGCDTDMAKQKLNLAIREFFLKSRSWRVKAGPYDVLADAEDPNIYLDPIEASLKVGYVFGVTYNGDRLKAMAVKPDETAFATPGKPTYYHAEVPGALRVYPLPTTDQLEALHVYCSVIPVDARQVPEHVATHHFETITKGALSKLLVMSKKPWTNPDLARVYGAQYYDGLREARVNADSAYQNGVQNWRFPYFAGNH